MTDRVLAGAHILAHLFPALLLTVLVEIGLRTASLPRLARFLGVPLDTAPLLDPPTLIAVWRLGRRGAGAYRAAQIVTALLPNGAEGACLRLSLVAGCLLRGRRPRLRVGVAGVAARAVAHSWITIGGQVVDPDVHRYLCMTSKVVA